MALRLTLHFDLANFPTRRCRCSRNRPPTPRQPGPLGPSTPPTLSQPRTISWSATGRPPSAHSYPLLRRLPRAASLARLGRQRAVAHCSGWRGRLLLRRLVGVGRLLSTLSHAWHSSTRTRQTTGRQRRKLTGCRVSRVAPYSCLLGCSAGRLLRRTAPVGVDVSCSAGRAGRCRSAPIDPVPRTAQQHTDKADNRKAAQAAHRLSRQPRRAV